MYQEILENHREEVEKYIETFLSNFELPKELNYNSSRIPIHLKNLLLSEAVYFNFFLKGEKQQLYDRAEFAESIIKSAYLQQQEVISADKETDLVQATYHVLSSKRYLKKVELFDYVPAEENYTYIRKSVIMVSNFALRKAICKYLDKTITGTALDKALLEAGVVEPEGKKATKSTSKLGCRHFFVLVEELCNYMKSNYGDAYAEKDSMIIDVVRKKQT
jgi:hypothetical protein